MRLIRPIATASMLAGGLLLLFSSFSAARAQAAASPTLAVSPSAGIVGSKMTVTGTDFPPNSSFNLQWSTAKAVWNVQDNPPRVTGINATPAENVLTSVQTSAAGSFSANLTVPTDYGGTHTIQLYYTNGTAINARGLFDVEPSFTISPTSGPVGTPIVVTAKGLGYGLYSSNYWLYWDNLQTGYFTAITTGGSTSFTFYASGAPGTHYIMIFQGYPSPAYLNPWNSPANLESQSEFGSYIPFHAEFTMTGDPTSSSSSVAASALVVLAAALASIGLFVTVSRAGPGARNRFAKQLAAVIIIIAIVAAGAGAYLAMSPSSSSSTTTASGFTPQATVVRPAISVTPSNAATTGPRISVIPLTASVGQNITVNGAGFQPNTQLPLSFSTREGDNILGYKLVALPLKNVTTSSSGAFTFSMPAPTTLGGLHYISAGNLTRNSNGTLFIQRTASINATEGPAGSIVAVNLEGVGWTFNTNIAAIDYDNSYIGYGCGFYSQGNVTFYLTVTGAPGIHTIDVYPAVWWGPSSQAAQIDVTYRAPLLTPQDHPSLMPSFHFTFLITSGSTTKSSGIGTGAGLVLLGSAATLSAGLAVLYSNSSLSVPSRDGAKWMFG
jgi:hypothetical protein